MNDTTRAGKAAQQALPISIKRSVGLDTAAKMLGGQAELASALAIEPRSLRAKIAMERGISNDDLDAAAEALGQRAQRILAHAEKLRSEILL